MARVGSEAAWEQHAVDVLMESGWQYLRGDQIVPGTGERTSWDELIIPGRLSEAMVRLNPEVPQNYLQQARAEIVRPQSNDSLAENFRLHQIYVHGYNGVTYLDPDGVERNPDIRLISHKPSENDWLVVNQVTLRTAEHHRRFDVVLYCNGLPVAIIELKRSGDGRAGSEGAHAQLALYLHEFPMAFRTVLLTVASDGATARYGTPYTGFEHFSPWNVDDDGAVVRPGQAPGDEGYTTPLAVLLYGLFNQERFLQLLRGYTAFSEKDGVLTKRIAKPHQYFAVTKAIGTTVQAVRSDGKAGVVWHTQGSGKSMEMELYAAAVHRTPQLDNPTIVVITDRRQLDGQLYETFNNSRLIPEAPVQLTSRAHLREALTGRVTGGLYFTTLQKFGLTVAERQAGLREQPVLTERRNVLVVVDEAHRSHYDDLDGYAAHLRSALPGASFLAFTGTPISQAEKDTRRVFGDYVDVYDLTRAVEDGATVPVYFEPRLIKLARPEGVTDEMIDRAADEATEGLDEHERAQVERTVAVITELYGHPERLRELASDILDHWDQRKATMRAQIETNGKAMIVTAGREVAARLYEEIVAQRRAAGDVTWHSDALDGGKIKVVYHSETTDNELVSRHRRRGSEQLVVQNRIKDPDDPLEMVIVSDMLLTGFDAPCLHTLYVDRSLKGALLMQTLARVNRTFRGKDNGLLVGYAPLAENLEAALAEYSDTDRTNKPQGRNVDEAVALALELLGQLDAIVGFEWRADLRAGHPGVAYLGAVTKAANLLLSPENRRAVRPESAVAAPVVYDAAVGDADSSLPLPAPGADQGTNDLGDTGEENLAAQHEAPYVRYRRLAGKLGSAWAVGGGSDVLAEKRIDFQFHTDVRIMLGKLEAEDRRATGRPVPEDTERLLKSVIVESASPGDVVDIYQQAGIERPNLGTLTPSAVQSIRETRSPNLAIEALRAALTEDARTLTGGNITRSRQFSERLSELMRRYVNSQLTAAEVLEELIRVAQEISEEARRGEKFDPPLQRDELAMFDAVSENESAVELMGDEVLAAIARELIGIMRRDTKTDWTVREDVRAKLRVSIRRLLVKHKYPPDKQPQAIALVMEQMETLAPKYAEAA